jgi:DNA-binding response OmpR family regulator
MKPSILIADRERFIAFSIAQSLAGRSSRYRVRIAQSADEAAHAIEHERPHVSILSHSLNGASGITVLERFATARGYERCSFLGLVESDQMDEVSPAILTAGADGIFTKPAKLPELSTRVAELVYLGRTPPTRKFAVIIGDPKAAATTIRPALVPIRIDMIAVGEDLGLAVALARSPHAALVIIREPIEVMTTAALIETLRSERVRVPLARISDGSVQIAPHPLLHELNKAFAPHDVDRILAKAIRERLAIPGHISVQRRDSARI